MSEQTMEIKRQSFAVTNWEGLIKAVKFTENKEEQGYKKTLVLIGVVSKPIEDADPTILHFSIVDSHDTTPFMFLLNELCQAEMTFTPPSTAQPEEH